MIDELTGLLLPRKDQLAALGVGGLPACWQFAQIDVPAENDSVPKGLEQAAVGGVPGTRYLSTGDGQRSYGVVDGIVSKALGPERIRELGSWAPKEPSKVAVPITNGAGQFRAVGRVITLARRSQVLDGLKRAWTDLANAGPALDAVATVFPEFGPPGQAGVGGNNKAAPIVLVVSSMAGGAGASMALDVCRILTEIPGLDPGLVGVFMYAPDVFDSLPADGRQGIRANALAMLGEIVAAQTGASFEHDSAMLGKRVGAGPLSPFARVFPVGAGIGTEGEQLADQAGDLYRALGRGLAALVTSGEGLHDFAAYDLGNPHPLVIDGNYFGWGVDETELGGLAWKSFGFASLSMGRDRYRHYASQRLARAAVDRLVEGHLATGATDNPQVQLDRLLDSTLDGYLREIGLPARGESVINWLKFQAIPEATYQSEANAAFAETVPAGHLQFGTGATVGQLRNAFANFAQTLGPKAAQRADQRAYALAYHWNQGLFQRSVAVFEQATARFGLAYLRGLIKAVDEQLSVVSAALGAAPASDANVFTTPAPIADVLAQQSEKAAFNQARQTAEQYWQHVRAALVRTIRAKSAPYFGRGLASFSAGVLTPLAGAAGVTLRVLEAERARQDGEAGLANLDSDAYPDWPSDSDDQHGPANRWDHAVTEVLITPAKNFPAQYRADLAASAQMWDGTPGSAHNPVARVIDGRWENAGGGASTPGDGSPGSPPPLIQVTQVWHSKAFRQDPRDGSQIVEQSAAFDVHARPKELRERALGFVDRPKFSFSQFVALSLADYLSVADAPARQAELLGPRATEIERLFKDTLKRAEPLVRINSQVAQATVPQAALRLDYKFSALPFQRSSVAAALEHYLAQPSAGVSQETAGRFKKRLNDSGATRVSVFGSYERLTPLAYSSLLEPIATEWDNLKIPAARSGFWMWRASRPLAARLPMADAERQAMVKGWFIAEIVGDLAIPSRDRLDQPVRVFFRDRESADRWLDFPNPLLTPPTSSGFGAVDWLPAVLESVLLAYARGDWPPVLDSLAPYRALRSVYDSGAEPAEGQSTLAAVGRLAEWLAAGRSPSGGESFVKAATQARTAEERAAAAKAWIAHVRQLVGQRYLPQGLDGAPGGGEYSRIETRAEAAKAPLYCQVARDVWNGLAEIEQLIDEALAEVLKAQAAVGEEEPDIVRDDLDEVF
jgi:hypothetical protein